MVMLTYEPRELFRCLFLYKKYQLILDKGLVRGKLHNAPAHPREIMRRALELSARLLTIDHNHPNDDHMPSQSDIVLT